MRVLRGKVVRGQVVIDGEPLPDGTEVTVYAADNQDAFELDAHSVRELLEAQADVQRGHHFTPDQVLAELND